MIKRIERGEQIQSQQKCELWRKTFGAVLQKYTVPEDWMYKEARRLFQEPEVTDPATLDVSTGVLCAMGAGIHSACANSSLQN